MGNTTTSRRDAIRHNQNTLLYNGIKYSAAGTFAASLVVVFTLYPYTESWQAYTWFALISISYSTRIFDCMRFRKSATRETESRYWSKRFYWGAISSACTWALSMWMIFPDNQAHQVLLVLALGAVAAGALASLPYDKRICLQFQIIIGLSVEVKLLMLGNIFSLELALYSLFAFGFLLSCGKRVGINYFELLSLKQDSQETNLTLFKTTEEMAQVGYWQWDQDSGIVELSGNLTTMLGFSSSRVHLSKCLTKVHTEDRRRIARSFNSVLDNGKEAAIEYRLKNQKYLDYRNIRQVIKRISDSQGRTYLLGTVQDITDIKDAQEKIYRMAYYDSLTGLANRAHFHEHLERYIQLARRNNRRFAIIYIDLDNFKGVNDSYGHECGDNYLRVFSSYIKNIARNADFVSRLGGDEFCILLHDTKSEIEARRICERCLEFTNTSIQIGNHQIHPKLSVGISQYPDDGEQSDQIVKSADLAMYHVKQNGKDSYAFYDEKMANVHIERVRLEADLRTALANEEFELWYQPQIDIRDDTVSGVEALIRWRHPKKGIISPDLFIATAERVGMIKDIGEWVLQTACAQLYEWNQLGYRLQMAVNISGDHFADAGFVEFVKNTVLTNRISSEDLEVEITESLSRDPTLHTRICEELRSCKIRVAIDDFGTGYSSLSVLGKLEVDTLKIDRSFIQNIPDDEASKLMVKTIADLSLGLGYDFVAEGVETQAQLAYLRTLKCPYVQGYYFSKPVLPEQIPPLIDSGNSAQHAA